MLKRVSLINLSSISAVDKPSYLSSCILSDTSARLISEYLVMSCLCPHTSPSSRAIPCISKNIFIDFDTVLVYDRDICTAFRLGHTFTTARISFSDGLYEK